MNADDNDRSLPRELVWEGAHVSDLALTAIADGQQEIVQPDAAAHAVACNFCAGRMARAALLSAAVGGAVVALTPSRPVSRERALARPAPAPGKALVLGVAVAALAAIPSLPQFTSNLLELLACGKILTSHGIPVLVRGGVALATSESAGRALSIATAVSSVLLVMMGWAIARTRSHETSDRSMS